MIIRCAVNFRHWQSFICCQIQSAFPCQVSCVYSSTSDLTVAMIYRPSICNKVCEKCLPYRIIHFISYLNICLCNYYWWSVSLISVEYSKYGMSAAYAIYRSLMSVEVSAHLKSSSMKSWGNLSDLNLQIFGFSQWDIWALRTIWLWGRVNACHRCRTHFWICCNQILTRNYLIQVLWIKNWSVQFVNT